MNIKIKKIIIVAGVLMMIFGVNIVFGEVISNSYSEQAEKFYQKHCFKPKLKGIKAFVCDSRQRVDNISKSSTLKVFDTNDDEVGYLISVTSEETATQSVLVFHSDLNIFVPYDFYTGNYQDNYPYYVQHENEIYYKEIDCEGGPYIINLATPSFLGVSGPHDNLIFYKADSYDDIEQNVIFASRRNSDDSCQNVSPQYDFAGKVHVITNPSVNGPLEIRVE